MCPGCRSPNSNTHTRHVGRASKHAARHWRFASTAANRAVVRTHIENVHMCKWLKPDAFDRPLVAVPIHRHKKMSATNFMLIEKADVSRNVENTAVVCATFVAKRLMAQMKPWTTSLSRR